MTDLEKFVQLYKDLGIDIVVNEEEEGFVIFLQATPTHNEEDTVSSKLEGYPGFYSAIQFDVEGKFESQGFWE